MNRNDMARVFTVAKTDIVAAVRRVQSQNRTLIVLTLVWSLALLVSWLFHWGAAIAGTELVEEGTVQVAAVAVPLLVGLGSALAMGGWLAMGMMVGGTQNSAVDTLVRTSVSGGVGTAGLMLSSLIRKGSIILLPAAGALTGLALGANSVMVGFLATVGFVLIVGVGLVINYVSFALGRLVLGMLGLPQWLKIGLQMLFLGGVLTATYLWTPQIEEEDQIAETLPTRIATEYASAVFAPLGTDPSLGGLLLVAASVATIAVGAGLLVGLECRIQQLRTPDKRPAVTSRPPWGPFMLTPGTRSAWQYLLRTVRNPGLLSHLWIIPIMLASTASSTIVSYGLSPGSITSSTVILGTILAGGAYCLNPLGEDQAQQPLVFTSTSSPHREIHGRAIAGFVLGSMLVFGIGVPVELFWGSTFNVPGLIVLSAVLMLSGIGTALGFGALAPAYEQSGTADRPYPFWPFRYGYLFGAVVIAGLGLTFLWAATGYQLHVFDILTWLVYFTVPAVPGIGGYAYARRRINQRRLDD